MAENSAIEWTDHTFNPWVGCTKVGPGCDHCYAEGWAKRGGKAAGVTWGGERRRTSDANWRQPLKWNAQAQREGRRYRVFCASLADVFDNQVPASWRAHLFALIEQTPHLDWLLLTKRIGNVMPMLSEVAHSLFWMDRLEAPGLPENVWLGATVVNQEEADRDIPKLLATPARVRFLSIEPMLGPIDLAVYHDWLGRCDGGMWCPDCPDYGVGIDPAEHAHCLGEVEEVAPYEGIDWVICGGESGPQARPMHPDWARSLRDQCAAAGVPFLFKQWGEWGPDWEGAETCSACGRTKFDAINSHGECGHCGIEAWDAASKPLDKLRRIGKKAAGRLLDGVTHDGFPSAEGGAA